MATVTCSACGKRAEAVPAEVPEPPHIRLALGVRALKWQTGPAYLCKRCKARVGGGRTVEDAGRLEAEYHAKRPTSGTPERVLRERHFARLAQERAAV